MITELRINTKGELEGKVIPPVKWEEMYTKEEVIAMLTEIQLEISEKYEQYDGYEPSALGDFDGAVSDIIQQKINALKEQTDGKVD